MNLPVNHVADPCFAPLICSFLVIFSLFGFVCCGKVAFLLIELTGIGEVVKVFHF